ncbi:MAG: VOC family protein [Actinobacteria bacterium]|nr:VOC family protein [Actinomycetota bacterium]
MKLEGIHHITAITGDAPTNVRFYVGTLGLRLVKKTVNQDDPTVYHLFYADEAGSPGSDLTFFEYPGAAKGVAGPGMVHRIVWRVASEDAISFWEERLQSQGIATEREAGSLVFSDPEGLELELRIDVSSEPALIADHPDIPRELALQGFDGVHAFSADPAASSAFLSDLLGFEKDGDEGWKARGEERSSFYIYDEAPRREGFGGAGTVHHVAWASPMEDHEQWHARLVSAGAGVTPIIDRFYFRSIYFREPSGVLFEIATLGPGFTADEPIESLGENLSLPPNFEQLRSKLEDVLTPLPDPLTEVRTR